MDRPIRKRKPDGPIWLINSLKVVLVMIFLWQIGHQVPDDYFGTTSKATAPEPFPSIPFIEEIRYEELLGTTHPIYSHYLKWGDKNIPYLDPETPLDNTPFYQLSPDEFNSSSLKKMTLFYKGKELDIEKVNAVFLNKDGVIHICEQNGNISNCFSESLKEQESEFELWLALETKEEKMYFSKLKISKSSDYQPFSDEEANLFWKNLINKEKHKSIDNLNVVKPVFRTNSYVLKWGKWERYAYGPRGGRRIKMDIQTLKELIGEAPSLYRESSFIPFSCTISLWNGKRRGNGCTIQRNNQETFAIENYECFKNLLKQAKAGDAFSLFIYPKDDFLSTWSPSQNQSIPGFIFNGQKVRLYVPVEIVENSVDPTHAPLNLTTTEFSFQLNNMPGEEPTIKMDTKDPKNEKLKKHYEESQSAKVIHIPGFKTIRRVKTEADVYLDPEHIDNTITLTEKIYLTNTFPEFYDFAIFPPLIKSGGLSTVLDQTIYTIQQYQKNKPSFELWVGEEKVKVLQLTFTVVPKKGNAIRYITNSLDRFDIKKRLNALSSQTSLYFEDILFERDNGEKMVFPLTTALHLK